MDVDRIFQPGAIEQANLRSALPGGAPVYMDLFSWQSPGMDGKYEAFHCIELPFVFNNIQRCENMTGGGRAAQNLANQVSQAWINFAHQGDPNHDGRPTWASYAREGGGRCFLIPIVIFGSIMIGQFGSFWGSDWEFMSTDDLKL